MSLTEKMNALETSNADERWKLMKEHRRSLNEESPSQFYMALPVSMTRDGGSWLIVYTVGLPNPQGGRRGMLKTVPATHSHSNDLVLVGEEVSLDFVYMMNMARINRKDA
jgi:hypothetical protein